MNDLTMGSSPVSKEAAVIPSDSTEEAEAEQVRGSSASLNSSRDEAIVYPHGIRLWTMMGMIALLFFLTTIETFIAVTALLAISKDLDSFETASWVLSSYQLGYVAVIVISAKLSDILGRKLVLIVSIVIFTALSGGCGAAQNMTQLVVLRAFQGVGAGGCFALCAIMMVELVPPAKLGPVVARTGIAIVMAMILGPIIGGAICDHSTWRWIFWLNVPLGAFALLLALVGLPKGFPHHLRPDQSVLANIVPSKTRARIDILGFFLVMAATVTFTAGFQEADARFAWDSAYVISLLVLSVVFWAALLLWERHVTRSDGIREPVLPWRFFTNRVLIGIMLGFLLVGGPMAVLNFQLPQRFQLINGMSSFDAGVRIIPFGASFSIGSIASANIASRLKVPAIYMTLCGSAFQIVGFALLSTLEASTELHPATYGYEVLCGVGCGVNYQILYLMVPFTTEKRDHAVGMGAANQFRYMGSAFGLAIATSVFNGYGMSRLRDLGIAEPTELFLAGESDILPESTQEVVRQILSEGYNRQMLVLCAFAAAQVPATLLMFKRKQVIVA
ncbi:unnamed protein product [Clonostachys solani]|uniref:Major facilitator superfamily (MFS) profile domain-containing protein n=1 Tax=Clonostachys solani TaxID=160281 RepID=A0A9N9ZAU8_9HYPO|nr:unnamed protein product [Clonostachys solani]